MNGRHVRKGIVQTRQASPLLSHFSLKARTKQNISPASVTITCLKHMTKTKAHYLVIDFLIRDIKVCFKKLT